MKTMYLSLIVILVLSFLLMPLLSFNSSDAVSPVFSADVTLDKDSFLIFLNETSEIKEISANDYIFSVIAANCPAEYHKEALKAEAVAAYTFALYKKQEASGKFDLNDIDQGYITEEALKEKWGDSYDETYKKFQEAVKEVKGQKILYNNSLAYTIRHDISSGKTEKAEGVLGKDYPYLTTVESVGDLLASDYLYEITVSVEEFKKTLQSLSISVGNDPSKYIEGVLKSEVGSVINYKICGKELSGEELKNIFSLPSLCFDISFSENVFKITSKGKGNGVGLSRWGANYMAMQGSSYEEILSWYYPSCTMTK